MAGDQHGLCVVGITGVDNWTIGHGQAVPELEAIPLQGRVVFICFDNDGDPKPRVAGAMVRLAAYLRSRGATVKVVSLPPGPAGGDGKPTKCGLDDFLLTHTRADLDALAAQATDPPTGKERKARPGPTPGTAPVPAGDLPYTQLHFAMTDWGNAKRLVTLHGQDLRYCHPSRRLFIWNSKRWREDDTAAVERRAKATVTSIYVEAAKAQYAKVRQQLVDHALKTEGVQRIQAMVSLAESEHSVPVLREMMDRDPLLLNVMNGTLDLRTCTLRPHDRKDMITKLAPVEFDENATCPLWLRCVDRWMGGNQNLIGYLQRLVGYCLTADVTEQKLWIFWGGGSNGKTTFVLTILSLLGDYASPAAPDLLLEKRGDTHPTEKADLFGRRFVPCIETEEGRRLAEALMKTLTGTDKVKARRMREDFWEFSPTHKLILACNHKPTVRGADYALWRRIVLVP